MFKLVAPRNLGPIPAVAATAFVALAIFCLDRENRPLSTRSGCPFPIGPGSYGKSSRC